MSRTIPDSIRELCLSFRTPKSVNGWVDLDINNGVNWDEVDALLVTSFRQIALKRMIKALDFQSL